MKRNFASPGMLALAIMLALLLAGVAPPAPAAAASTQPQTTVVEKALVLLVDFNNVQLRYDDAFWRDRMFSGTTQSVSSYYDEATYGKYRFEPADETYGQADDGVVHVTLDEAHPGGTGVAENQDVAPCIIRSLEAADAYVDFASFDANGDRRVTTDELHIVAVFAGHDASDSRAGRPAIWAHANYDALRSCSVDGVALTTYIAQGETFTVAGDPIGIGTIVHELGHSLGLVDLYDLTGASIGLGTSSLMASGPHLGSGSMMLDGSSPAHFDPWSLIQIGVRTPQVVTQDATVTLYASNTPEYNIVKVPLTDDGKQYFLLENRVTEGYDRGLRDDTYYGGAVSGVAIYHVDEWIIDTWNVATYGVLRGVNSNYRRKGVDLEESNGPALDQPWDSPHGGDHYFYDGGHIEFGPDTYPDTGAYVDTLTNGTTTPSGVRIQVSGESGSPEMQVRITFGSTATPAGFAGGDGSIGSPYRIATKTQLDMVRRHAEAHFVLTDDLVFTDADYAPGGAFCNNGKGFRPLFASAPFEGTFDGAGHKIVGLRVNVSGRTDTYAGLFGMLSGTVKNVELVDAGITATSETGRSHAGAVAGKAFLGLVKGCSVSGSVTADYAGGVVGTAAGSDILGCRNAATVSSPARYQDGFAGGIAGEAFRTSISRCSNRGAVTASSSRDEPPNGGTEMVIAGGIVGNLFGVGSPARVSQCFNSGAVTATSSRRFSAWSIAGGIAAWTRYDAATTIADSYNAGAVSAILAGGLIGEAQGQTISRCYNVGTLAGDGEHGGYLGGVAGRAVAGDAGGIADCYFVAADENDKGVGYWLDGPVATDPTTPCTPEAMRTQDCFSGFDFAGVWVLASTTDHPYPQLRAHRQALEQPGVPTLTTTAVGYDSVTLTWSEVANATAYELSRATAADGPYQVIASAGTDSHTDTGLATGTRHYYTVRAVVSEGGLTVRGPDSQVTSARPTLARVGSLTLKKTSPRSIRAAWRAVPGASGYQLYRAKATRSRFVLVKTTRSRAFTDMRLARGTTYFYKVRAYRLVEGIRVYGAFSSVAKRTL